MTKEETGKIVIKKGPNLFWIIGLAVTLGLVFAGISLVMSDTNVAQTSPEVKQPIGDGSERSNQQPIAPVTTEKKQEEVNGLHSEVSVNQWFAIGEQTEIKLDKLYGITVKMTVTKEGYVYSYPASSEDTSKLFNAKELLVVNTKFKRKGTNEIIYETGPVIQPYSMIPFTEYPQLKNGLIKPEDIVWQPEFSLKKDTGRKETTKISVS